MITKRYLDERAVSELIARSLSALRADRHYGRGLPYVKLGRQIRYDIEDIHAEMAARKIRPEDAAQGERR